MRLRKGPKKFRLKRGNKNLINSSYSCMIMIGILLW